MSFWLKLYSVTRSVAIIFGNYILYYASFFVNFFFSFYPFQTENKNWRLKVMIFTLLIYAASLTVSKFCLLRGYYTSAKIINAFVVSFGIYIHWMLSYIYLKQQIEVKYLLDNRIYAFN